MSEIGKGERVKYEIIYLPISVGITYMYLEQLSVILLDMCYTYLPTYLLGTYPQSQYGSVDAVAVPLDTLSLPKPLGKPAATSPVKGPSPTMDPKAST